MATHKLLKVRQNPQLWNTLAKAALPKKAGIAIIKYPAKNIGVDKVLNKIALVLLWFSASAMNGLSQQTIPVIRPGPTTYKVYLTKDLSKTNLANFISKESTISSAAAFFSNLYLL